MFSAATLLAVGLDAVENFFFGALAIVGLRLFYRWFKLEYKI